VLGLLGISLGFAPWLVAESLIQPAATAAAAPTVRAPAA
jgi:hypothetical protein